MISQTFTVEVSSAKAAAHIQRALTDLAWDFHCEAESLKQRFESIDDARLSEKRKNSLRVYFSSRIVEAQTMETAIYDAAERLRLCLK